MKTLMLMVFCTSLCLPALAQNHSFTRAFPPGTSDARIGRGYDSATNEIKSQCIVFNDRPQELATVVPGGSTDAQDLSFKMTYLKNSEDLLNSLSINAAASFGWGVFSGDASISYATNKHVSRFGEYLLIDETVQNITQFLVATRLTTEASAVKNNPFEFRRLCGDQFIVGIETGGSFYAVLEASANSEEEQSDIRTTFSAAAYGGKLDAQTMAKFKELTTNNSLNITVIRKGPADNVPADMDSVKSYAESLPGKVRQNGGTAWPILMTTKEYGSLAPTISGSQGVFLNTAGEQYMRLNRLIAGLEYIAANKDLFGGFDQAKYDAEYAATERAANDLSANAEKCSKDSTKCFAPAFTLPRELPDRIRWISVDPKTDGWTTIAHIQGSQNRVAEARGQWSRYGPGSNEWLPASSGSFMIRPSNGVDQILQADHVISLPDNCNVYYRIFDSPPEDYFDNRSLSGDPLRIAVYTPLYPILATGLVQSQR